MFPGDYFLDQNHDLEPNDELTCFLDANDNDLLLVESPLSEIITKAFNEFNQGLINDKGLVSALKNRGYMPRRSFLLIIDYAFNNNKQLMPIGLTDDEMIEQLTILSNKFNLKESSLIIGYSHKGVIS